MIFLISKDEYGKYHYNDLLSNFEIFSQGKLLVYFHNWRWQHKIEKKTIQKIIIKRKCEFLKNLYILRLYVCMFTVMNPS